MARASAACLLALVLHAGTAAAGGLGQRGQVADIAVLELDLDRYRSTQRAGLVLFGVGLGLELVGVALTQVDPWGPIGISGFATLGTGIAVATIGMITLAVSRRRWQQTVREVACWRPSGPARGGGLEPG